MTKIPIFRPHRQRHRQPIARILNFQRRRNSPAARLVDNLARSRYRRQSRLDEGAHEDREDRGLQHLEPQTVLGAEEPFQAFQPAQQPSQLSIRSKRLAFSAASLTEEKKSSTDGTFRRNLGPSEN